MRMMASFASNGSLWWYALLIYIVFLTDLVCAAKPNVIIILADDLGYGDLQVSPFRSPAMRAISTPHLLKMAQSGVIMDNFHTAAPICSPTRASIMTSLFPWRLGVDFIYAGDKKGDGSVEIFNDHLPMIPNIAMNFKDSGYATSHVGKWHLGGMHNQDIDRRSATKGSAKASNAKPSTVSSQSIHGADSNMCSVPGINQYGFTDYVSVAEGTGSDSQIAHMRGNLYHTGSQMMVRNDRYMSRIGPGKTTIGSTNDYNKLSAAVSRNSTLVRTLTEAETDHAMEFISLQAGKQTPFFLNLWYHAPHSPWEVHEPYYSQYVQSNTFETERMRKYASMITHMDDNIGRLLHLLDDLGIADNTLVVFTSDNGPEIGAGSAGIFKGHKRLLSEGGIRVPCIWQWKGRMKMNSITSKFGITTDIWPTVAEAAGLTLPDHIRIDGTSLLPALMQSKQSTLNIATRSSGSTGSSSGNSEEGNVMRNARVAKDQAVEGVMGDERLVLWYATAPGYPRFSAAWSHGIKFVWNDYEGRKRGKNSKLPNTFRAFDMYKDPTEQFDLMQSLREVCSKGAGAGSSSSSSGSSGSSSSSSGTGSGGGGDGKDVMFKYFSASSRPLSSHPPYLRAMVEYLQLYAHLFRHIAPHDWYHYIHNRLTLTRVGTLDRSRLTCGIYSSTVPSLPWSTSGLQPQFCGTRVYAADLRRGRPTCLCSLDTCSGRWGGGNNSKQPLGWTSGTIPQGLVPFMTHNPQYTGNRGYVNEGGKQMLYSQETYYRQLLHTSRYTAACTAPPLLSISPVASLVVGDEETSTSTDMREKRDVLEGESHCHHEQPVSILDELGTALPLFLCASSLYSMRNESHIDLSLYQYVLNDVLYKDAQDTAWFSYLVTGNRRERKTDGEREKERSKCPALIVVDPTCIDGGSYRLSPGCTQQLSMRIAAASPYYATSAVLMAPLYDNKGNSFRTLVFHLSDSNATSYILSLEGEGEGEGGGGGESEDLMVLHLQLAELMAQWPSKSGISASSFKGTPQSMVIDTARGGRGGNTVSSRSDTGNAAGGLSMWWALYSLKTALCQSPSATLESSVLQVPRVADMEAFTGSLVHMYEQQGSGQRAEVFRRIAATTYSASIGGSGGGGSNSGGGKKGGRGGRKGK